LAEKSLRELPEEFPIPEDIRRALQQVLRRRPGSFYEKFCKTSGRIFGWAVRGYRLSERTSKELREAGLRVSGEDWAAATLLTLVLPILPFLILWMFSGNLLANLYLPMLGFLIGGLGMMVFQIYPSSLAASRKSKAQSTAINTIMLLSFSLYHRPDLRGATVYAADSSEGKLAEDLQRGLLEMDERRRYETVRHLLTKVANEWGEVDDSVRQAIFDILRSTGTKDEATRILDVSKAPGRVLEGAEEMLARRLGGLVMPTLAFLTFGSLAIIGTIGLSPVFGIIGMQLVDVKFFAGIAIALVVAFLAFTTYMGRRRPVTVQISMVWEEDPRLPPPGKVRLGRLLLPAWLPPILVFIAVGWPGVLALLGVEGRVLGTIVMSFSTLWLVWAVGAAVAVYSYLYIAPRKKVREEERRRVGDWANALNTIGSRMLDGKPAQIAMREASELMSGSPLSSELADASSKMDEFGMRMDEAVFRRGKRNPVISSFLRIISQIRKDNEAAAGRACMMAAEFLRTLHRVERRFRERIDEAMGNLWLVAVVLIPVVCAMSVWVMDFMSGMKYTVVSQVSTAGVTGVPFLLGAMEASELSILRLVMGLTAIALSVVIARYIAEVKMPGDKVELWSAILKSVVLSLVIFTATSFLLTFVVAGGI